MNKTIFIIGFMGAGKTTIGKKLAEDYGRQVIDTDEWIEEQEKMKIRDIFQQHGETYFRKLESQALFGIGDSGAIITTGGGIILDRANRKRLKESGRTVFLQCEPEVFLERLEGDDSRPLIRDKSAEEIIDLYKARLPLYLECASAIVDTGSLSVEDAVKAIAQRMNL